MLGVRCGDGPRVLAMGDSVSLGIGDVASSQGFVGWAGHVASALEASSFLSVANTGARAKTLVSVQLPKALMFKPDLALIVIGGNDVLRGNLRPLEIRNDVAACLKALRNVNCDVVLLRLHDPRRTLPLPRLINDALFRRVQRVNNALDAAAIVSELGECYIDVAQDLQLYEKKMWHIDCMHPSAYGHRWIAQQVLKVLESRGFRARQPIEEPPLQQTSPWVNARWLIRHGTPWLLRRSIDLIPAAALLLMMEMIFPREYEDLTKGLA